MAEGPCSQGCATCRRRRATRLLKDRKGYEFPIVNDARGRTHLYNAVPLDAISAIPDLIEVGVAAVRLDLETHVSQGAAAALVARVVSAVQRASAGLEITRSDKSSTTSGHFYRGIS